jgi:hypothetical protein
MSMCKERRVKPSLTFIVNIVQMTYDLQYWVAGRKQETPVVNKPKSICVVKKFYLANTTHKVGRFKLIKNVEKKTR